VSIISPVDAFVDVFDGNTFAITCTMECTTRTDHTVPAFERESLMILFYERLEIFKMEGKGLNWKTGKA